MVTITISGSPGTGTTTISRLLKKKLKIPYVYAGNIFREEAKKYGMSLEEFGRYCEKNEEIDRKLDEYQKALLERGNLILEGRMAGWLAYLNNISAEKILLTADMKERVRRILNREGGTIEKIKKEMKKREESEAKRYKRYYNVDIGDHSIYDLVIDTTNKTPEEIVDIILSHIGE